MTATIKVMAYTKIVYSYWVNFYDALQSKAILTRSIQTTAVI